jgi:transposase
MFIRKTRKKDPVSRKAYFSYQLVESIRTEKGPRQRILLNLGSKLDLDQKELKLLANRIEEIISDQSTFLVCPEKIESLAKKYASRLIQNLSKPLPEQKKTAAIPEYTTIDINSVLHEKARTIGNEHILLETVKQLKIPEKLKELKFTNKQINIALASIIARASFPASERATYSQLIGQSALGELLNVDFESIPLNRFYEISDLLLKHKNELETHISEQQKKLHGVTNTIILYDLTNTYFEGQAQNNPKGKFGVSKEKRKDCPLVTLGLVLNQHGFLTRSEFLAGNVSEPKTLQAAIKSLYSSEDLFKPTIAMDAGIATEENLQWLAKQGYGYVVSARKKAPIGELSEDAVFVGKNNKFPVKVREVCLNERAERWLHCESPAKEAKASAMKASFQQRFECDLQIAEAALSKPRGTKKFEKVLERIGRIKQKHNSISSCYEINVIPSEDGKQAKKIEWRLIEGKFKAKLTGSYYLRSNLIDKSAKELWDLYHMMQVVETAFRFMKSSLGMRPVYHQKEKRVDGHLWITILAYSLIQDILYRLNSKGISYSWETIRRSFNSRIRVTTSAKTQDRKQLYLRSTTKAEESHLQIYNALALSPDILKTKKLIK